MTGGRPRPRGAARRHVGSRGWAVSDASGRDGVVVRTRAPLVGRVQERERLRSAAVSAASGRPQVVVITGPTGIGKSRLLEEGATAAKQRGLEPAMLHCQFQHAGDFAPLRLLARRWAGAEQPDDWVLPGPSVASQADRWIRRIAELADGAPMALCIDDVHHADPGTAAVIRHLVWWCERQPVNAGTKLLVLLTSADEHPLDMQLPAYDAGDSSPIGFLTLAPLATLETVELVRQLGLGDVPRAAAEAVAERCAGNPLTARVVTDILISHSKVGPGSLERHLTLDDDTTRLPRSPIGTIERQFEELDPATRVIVATAAAMDADMPVSWLVDLTGEDADQIDSCLHYAADLDILEFGDTVTFRHPLSRERARAELSSPDLQTLHLRIALLLLAEGGESSIEAVDHLRRAGARADPELVYTTASRAGQEATDRQEWGAAARCLQYAATIGRNLPTVDDTTLVALSHSAAKALQAAGEVEEARRWADRAVERARAVGDHDELVGATLTAARCRVWGGDFGDVIDASAVEVIARDEAATPERRAEAKLIAAETAWMSGDYVACLLWSADAYVEAEAVGAASLCAQALVANATGHWLRLELRDSLEQLRASTRWAKLVSDPGSTATSEGRLALNYWWLGAPDRATQSSDAALEAADRASTPLERAVPLAAVGAIAACRGDHELALSATAEAELLSSLSGDTWSSALSFPVAAASAAWHGHRVEARAQLERWSATQPRRPSGAGSLTRILLDMHRRYVELLDGEADAAWWRSLTPPPFDPSSTSFQIIGSATFFGLLLEAAQRLELDDVAIALLPYLESIYTAGHMITTGWPLLVPRLAAAAARLAGQPGLALEHAQHALRIATSGGLVVETGRVHLEIARCLPELHRDGETDEHLRAARTIAEHHRLEFLADELEQARD